jgi:hypothetical protein
MITAKAIRKIFFLPKKTIARAIQPRPLEMFGTKDEILSGKKQPAIAPKNAAIHHAAIS